MKAVAGFALVAAVHAAGWQDTPVDPAKSTTTTSTKPAEETQSYWGDVPVDPTTTTTTAAETWSDYDPSKSTTTTKPAEETTHTWSDYSVPVEETTTTTATWSDYSVPVEETSTTTATWGDVSPAPVDPAQTWVDAAVGSCKVVTVTKTGSWIWVPAPAEPTSADPTWSDIPVAPTTTTSSAAETWSDFPVDPTSSSTTTETWGDYTPAPTTTVKPTWTKPTTLSTSTKASTTSSVPKPSDAVCPADNGKTLPAAGSCGGSFQINCGVKATPGAGSKFWQKTEGEKVPTLAGCLAICNENALCESVLYVQSAGSSDDQLCWQTSGLGPVTGTGYAQIAYKTGAKGKCAASYTKA